MSEKHRNIKQVYLGFVDKLENFAENSADKSNSNYIGNKDLSLHMSIPQLRSMVKEFVKKNKDLTVEEWKELMFWFNNGEYNDEKTVAAEIIKSHRNLKQAITIDEVDKLLDTRRGWLQVDTLCQTVFGAEDMVENWDEWHELILDLSVSDNINKRRASLVLLTKPVRQSEEVRFSRLAFEMIEKLKHERDKLITKAVSWLLRTLIKHHREEVIEYLDHNEESLPSIAVRETRKKLETGRK